MPEHVWDLSAFKGTGYDIGRGYIVRVAWLLVSGTIFMRWWLPASARVAILRTFGADIADGVLVRHRVRIHWPWKLSIGPNSWVGEGAWLLNLETITIGSNVCISQEALLCTGSHNRRSDSFEFDNAPIHIDDSSWVATRATILRGVSIGRGSVIGASSVITCDVPPGTLVPAGDVMRHGTSVP